MACLKMPEVNHVLIAGNLTKDPVIRKTTNGIPVANFCLASNHKYRDAQNQWAEDVCYVGVVAWSKLAESCMDKLRKGSAVLVDGELQSRTWHTEDGSTRTVVEIKAHRIQFLNKQEHLESGDVMEMSEDFEAATPSASTRGAELWVEPAYQVGCEETAGVMSEGCSEKIEGLALKLRPRNVGSCE